MSPSAHGLTVRALCRHESLEADFADLVTLINSLKEAQQPALASTLHAGEPVATAATSDPLDNKDVLLFEQCGVRCMDLARIYYIDDFDVFKYSQTLNDPPNAARRRQRRRHSALR